MWWPVCCTGLLQGCGYRGWSVCSGEGTQWLVCALRRCPAACAHDGCVDGTSLEDCSPTARPSKRPCRGLSAHRCGLSHKLEDEDVVQVRF